MGMKGTKTLMTAAAAALYLSTGSGARAADAGKSVPPPPAAGAAAVSAAQRAAAPTAAPAAASSVPSVAIAPSGGAASAAPAPSGAAPAAADSLADTRGALERWVETQQIISREKKDWQQGRELLTSRIQLVKDEIAHLRESLAETHKNEQDYHKSRSEVDAEREAVKTVSAELAGELGALESQVRALYTKVPESLRDKLQPLYDRMPKDPATSRVTVAERFQNVLGILNEMNRLNGEVTVASEIRSLSDGKPSEVKTLYLGLGQAWYLSARGEAGVGRPTATGWAWQSAPEIAAEMNRALDILSNKTSPKFVQLPVTIR
jgi:hypothetical protein